MKKLIRTLLAASALILSATGLYAQQNFRTAYFMEGYTQRYKFNPAFAAERDFVSAGIADANLAFSSNVSLSAILLGGDKGHGAQTFLSSAFDASNMMDKLQDINKLSLNANASIATSGFWTGKVFHTIDVSLRSDVTAKAPKDLFEVMKNCVAGTPFTIGDIQGNASIWTEIGYGISAEVYQGIRIGARAKFLMGNARMDLSMNNTTLTPDGSYWKAFSENRMDTYFPQGLRFVTHGEHGDVAEGNPIYNFLKFKDMEQPAKKADYLTKFPGFGASFDLGISADFAEYFTLSASVTDLGFLKWGNHRSAVSPTTPWRFEGFSEVPESEKLADQIDKMTDMLDECYAFEYTEDSKAGNYAESKMEMLTLAANLGFEYRMPFYDRLSFGLLGSMHYNKNFQWYEGRFNATVSPADWVDIAADYAYSTFGHSVGLAANFHIKGMNLFLGTDSLIPILAMKKGVPQTKTNSSLTFGLNITFGELHKIH